VRGLFWVDGRTRELYKSFGDCIFLDTTFYTNRYNMLFAPIVGINNHLQSILLGCALLPDETTETFVWMLEGLKEAMGGREPTMTDQDKAMKAPIAIVFPKAVHRCCKWHVLGKATEKFAWLISHEKDFAKEFDYCVNCTETPEEYEGWWAMLGESTSCKTMSSSKAFQQHEACGLLHTSEITSFLSRAEKQGLKA
jgi:hypothetical protein